MKKKSRHFGASGEEFGARKRRMWLSYIGIREGELDRSTAVTACSTQTQHGRALRVEDDTNVAGPLAVMEGEAG